MKLYENVVIGNFLYGLGFSIGHASMDKVAPSVINLLQQTPDDEYLGDVLIEHVGVVRLIEFKNRKSDKAKEVKRVKKIRDGLATMPRMLEISKMIHWYFETQPFEETCVNKILPYVHAFEDYNSLHTMESYIHEITAEVIEPDFSISSEEFKEYIALVSRLIGPDSGGIRGGGLLAVVSNGELRYVQFANISQLKLQHKEFVNQIELQMITDEKSMMQKYRAKELSMSKGHGMSR